MQKFITIISIVISIFLTLATPASAQRYHGGWHGGYHGGWRGGYHNNNWWVPGAIIGGAIVGSALIYNGVRYNDAVSYCSARYRSYDPVSGTFLGSDGFRHPCP